MATASLWYTLVCRYYRLLEAVVRTYEESAEPVVLADVAERMDTRREALHRPVASLRAYELVALTDDGYRPTVTAYELLELDVDPDDVLIFDFED